MKRVSQGIAGIVGLLSCFGLHQLVTEPKRVSDASTTLIRLTRSTRPPTHLMYHVRFFTSGLIRSLLYLYYTACQARVANINHRRKIWLYRHTDLNVINDFLEAESPAILEDVPIDVDVAWDRF